MSRRSGAGGAGRLRCGAYDTMNCATGAAPRGPAAARDLGERRRRGTCCRHRERESRDGEAPERVESGQSSRPWGNRPCGASVPRDGGTAFPFV